MSRICYIFIGLWILLIGTALSGLTDAKAQIDPIRRGGRLGGAGASRQGTGDSIAHRTGLEDSITIRFRYLDTSRLQTFDSSIYDFTRQFPVPWTHIHLGNFGNASRNLQFSPNMQPGWDHGFHAYDIYNLTVEDARFYNTTRPYTHISYLLGSRAETFVRLQHTQNVRPNWNMGLEYRLISTPGFFQNQNTNHNNYRFTSWYQSRNKRYQNFIIIVGNKLQSGENGGIKTDVNYLDSAGAFDERLNIPTQLGTDNRGGSNPFSVIINTGSFFTNATYMMRQQYDLGQKDSLVTDSTVIPLFYPRLRLEHTIAYSTYKYRFRDSNADSTYYSDKYDITLEEPVDSFFIQDYWRVLLNDFSIYQFPDAKNAQQFIKLGASLQTLQATLDSGRINKNHYNFFVHGEYRNKTRNQKWDIEASGNFFVNGFNAGDYNAIISLKRLISKKNAGFLQLGFKNTNRTPSYVFDPSSSFYLGALENFNKENKTTIFGSLDQERRKLKIYGAYHLLTNYTYYAGFYQAQQASALFNVVQALVEKKFPLGKKGWNWKTWILLQQRLGDGPVNLPLLTTRNQLGYDGKLGFKNLQISFGVEMRYFTPYKAPVYSPLIGQYSFQDTTTISLKLPDITGYVHFRIKSFTAYVRAQNLNALDLGTGNFTNNNIPTLNYPYPGLQIRLGIFWSFVN